MTTLLVITSLIAATANILVLLYLIGNKDSKRPIIMNYKPKEKKKPIVQDDRKAFELEKLENNR